LPGGKLEPGETPSEGLVREIREELSLSCEPGRLMYDGILPAGDKQYRFMVFEATLSANPVASNAYDLLAWVRSGELVAYALAPLDVPVLGKLMNDDVAGLEIRTTDQGLQGAGSRVKDAVTGKDFPI
jgi:8-oxo-dGTP pyrophosphatase MutT (NUDIX family)